MTVRSEILCAGWCLAGALGALGESVTVADELVLARRGAPAEYAVVLPTAASDAQKYASEELVKHVEMTTGVKLPVVTEREARPAKGIFLGGEAADLGEEGFRLKTDGPNLRICGSAVRGTLYGVYELLERFAGCRWYASWCTIAPPRETIAVPADLDEAQRPAFPCREPHWWDMFKPDLPVQPLLDDFFAGYYGAAAPHVRRVFEQTHALQLAAAAEGRFLKIYEDPNASPLTDAFLEDAALEMEEAARAVKDDPLRSYNVRMTSFGVDYMRAERLRRGGVRLVDFVRGDATDDARARLRSLVRSLLARMDEAKDIRLGSGDVKGRHARLLEAWRRVDAGADAPCAVTRGRDGRRTALVEDASLNILKEGFWAKRVADPRAGDGRAIEISNVHYGWCVTLPFTHVAFRPGRTYRCEVRLRVEPAAGARPEAQAFSAGVYDNGLKKGRCAVQRKIGEIPDGEYAWYDLDEWTPGETADKQYFWAATGYFNKQEPGAHSAVKAVYLDALRLSE